MNATDTFYHDLENNFLDWAKDQEDIRTVFILGSRARKDHPADQWSDMDIILAVKDADTYYHQTDWVQKFGDILTCLSSRTAMNDPELLVLYEGGYQVDYVFCPLQALEGAISANIIPDTFFRGVRLLLDKDGLGAKLLPASFEYKPSSHINENDYEQAVQWFWFTVHYVTRQLLRQDLWYTKSSEGHIRGQIQRMLEWYAVATHEEGHDIWHAGRFMKEWLDEKTYDELKGIFSGFDISASAASLLTAMELYRRIAITVADKYCFTYPLNTDERISTWIKERLSNLI